MDRPRITYAPLAEVSPRSAILEGWLVFENAAGRIAEGIGLAKSGVALQMPDLIDGLRREGLITEGEAKALSRLRAVRNRAVHGRGEIQAETAAEYAGILQQIAQQMEGRAKTR